MSVTINAYDHLSQRCSDLIDKYLTPIITAEQEALSASAALPTPDFDSIAALRLLSHAEIEGYFEAKAKVALDLLNEDFKKGKVATSKFASLIFLYMLKKQITKRWQAFELNDDASIKKSEYADFKELAQEALGYGRQFIDSNNGIKESSIQVLSALMGYFNDELDPVLLNELNQYGKKRGDVAHDSWTKNTRTFESAEIEKNRLLTILTLIKNFYEGGTPPLPVQKKESIANYFVDWWTIVLKKLST